MIYSLKLIIIQRLSNKKILLVSLVSLIVGFIFVLIFVGKTLMFENIKDIIRDSIINDSNIEISWYPIDSSKLDIEIDDSLGEHSLSLSFSSLDLKFKNNKKFVRGLVKDKNINKFLRLNDMNSRELSEFFSSEKNVIINYDTSRKLGISEGDELLLNGLKKKCFKIQDELILMSNHDILINTNKALRSSNSLFNFTVITEPRYEKNILNELKFLSPSRNKRRAITLASYIKSSIRIYNNHIKDLFYFTLFFLFIAISNLYLIFSANITIYRRSIAIKNVYGETNLRFFLSEIIYSVFFAILAFNISIILYLKIRNFLPSVLNVDIRANVYLYSLMITTLISLLLTFINTLVSKKNLVHSILRT